MPKRATVKYKSLRTNLVHLPLSLYAKLAQRQARPQGLIIHLAPLSASSSRSSPKSAYLGWSGLAAASSIAGIGAGSEAETIELDPEVALNLGWNEGTLVEISVIHNPTKAKSVSVTPLSSDDWEILEKHASFLENNLLGQIRAAQKGQEIDVWVIGRTKIRIRVDETNPPTSSTSAVLITPDTEIFVAPRQRTTNVEELKESVTFPSENQAGPSKFSKTLDRTVELRYFPEQITRKWSKSWNPGEGIEKLSGGRIALCSPATLRGVKKKLNAKDIQEPLSVRLDRVQAGTDDEEEEAEGSVSLNKGSIDGAIENEDTLRAWLLPWDQMPNGHVVIRGALEDAWAGWGKLRVATAVPMKGQLKRSRGETAEGTERQDGEEANGLVGVDETISRSYQSLKRGYFGGNRTLLLLGGKGSGKTSMARAVSSYLEADRDILTEPIHVDISRIDADGRIAVIKETMAGWFSDAEAREPALLILDGLDLLLGPENESSDPVVLAEYFAELVRSMSERTMLLVTANSATSLHPSLTTNHIFGETVKIPMVSKEIRQQILELLVRRQYSDEQVVSHSAVKPADSDQGLDFVTLAGTTEGYSPADLTDLAEGASQQAAIRRALGEGEDLGVTMRDFVEAQKAFTPVSLRGVSLQKSDVNWSDIGGLYHARQLLRETLEWPTKYAQIFNNCPLRLRSGLLLYGYPGCGKTLLASAVAKECGLNFISVKGPEILNKYIGASEKAVRDLFERASAAKPCVLFFDEFDSIAPKRGHDSTGVTDRVVNQMLTEMDGAQGLDGVYVLAATSRPDLIDSALLRPGRLDKAILCDMPDMTERLDILQALARKLHLAENVMLDQIAADTNGFSGADLQAVLYNAHLEVVHASLDKVKIGHVNGGQKSNAGKSKGKGKGKGKDIPNGVVVENTPQKAYRQLAPHEEITREEGLLITSKVQAVSARSNQSEQKAGPIETTTPIIEQVHLLRSLASSRPSVAAHDRERLQRIYRGFSSDRDGNMQDGDFGRSTGTRVSLM